MNENTFTYSRCLHPEDYAIFDEYRYLEPIKKRLSLYRYEHEHRKWEYGLAIKFLLENKAASVLDVGGGGSILAPVLSILGMDVTVIDSYDCSKEIEHQSTFIGKNIKFIQDDWLTHVLKSKYDAIISISVIEHIDDFQNCLTFFTKMCDYSKDVVFITVDFHPSGERKSNFHFRTFDDYSMRRLMRIGLERGYYVYGDVDWRYKGNFVYDYTFASLAMKRRHNEDK